MNLNIVQIIGRITKPLEVRVTQGGSSLLLFSVATNHVWKDQNGDKHEEVEYHSVTAFGKKADAIQKYFNKGDEIYIMGRLKTSSWEDKSGTKRYQTSIIAEDFKFGQKKQQETTSEYPAIQPKKDLSDMPDIEDAVEISNFPF